MSAIATVDKSLAEQQKMDHQLDYQNQYVSFWVDNQLLGVPVNAVQEVLNPQTIARTPHARPEISGLLNLRGQIVTAINLRKRMGLPDREGEQKSMNVVLQHKDESFSILVDEVGDVINVPSETMEPVPHTLEAHWKTITRGVFRLDERLFIILNVEAILTFN